MYLLVKVISRMFLPSSASRRQGSGPGFIYTIFDQYTGQQSGGSNGSQQRPSNSGNNKNIKQRLDQIEEAEYEEIVDEESEDSKSK